MKKNKSELFVGIFVTIFSLILYFYIIPTQVTVSIEKKFSSLYFPKVAVLCLVIISLTILLQSIYKLPSAMEGSHYVFNTGGVFRVSLALLLFAAGYISLKFFGYIIVTTLSMVGWMFLFKETNWKSILLVSLLTTVSTYYLFTTLMGVNLPRGVLFDALSEFL